MEPTPVVSPSLTPWLSIWTHPRRTIRQVLEDDVEQDRVLLLAALGGIQNALDQASERSMGDTIPIGFILVIAVVFGSLGGILGMYVMAALIQFTQRLFGGTASAYEIRAVYAWSNVPMIPMLALWLLTLLLWGDGLFRSDFLEPGGTVLDVVYLFSFIGVALILVIWGVVIFLLGLSEVQRYGVVKALLNSIVAFLVILVPILLLMLPFIFLTS